MKIVIDFKKDPHIPRFVLSFGRKTILNEANEEKQL